MTYDTDKYEKGLIEFYSNVFDKQRYTGSILEIGVLHGGFIEWLVARNQFSKVVGIDKNPIERDIPGSILIQCDQNDKEGLIRVAEEHGPFDVIIDDGSHYTKETLNCFQTLWSYTRHLYFIEDWDVAHIQPESELIGGMIYAIADLIQKIPFYEASEMGALYLSRRKALPDENPGKYRYSVFYLRKDTGETDPICTSQKPCC